VQQAMNFVNHISDHDLERYFLGMVKDEVELASLEEHLLACPACAKRAESTQDYVDALRAGLATIQED
jgi:anti-sigma factor RsiW